MVSEDSRVYWVAWHVAHGFSRGAASHMDASDGVILFDEDEGDVLRLVGVFSSQRLASAAVSAACDLKGFADEPVCFWIEEWPEGSIQWQEGFTRG